MASKCRFYQENKLFANAFTDSQQREIQRCLAGKAKIAASGIGIIIANNLYSAKIGTAKTFFLCGFYDRELIAVEVYQIAADDFAGDRVDTADKEAQRPGDSIDGTLTFHCDNAVDDRHNRARRL